jgi:thiamine biosynthesis lipoprotein
MVHVLRQHGVRHALASLDGELRAVGGQASGQPWAVALERPEVGRRAVHGVLELDDLAVATSGDYRRYLDVGEVRLAHTMDARRCAPVNNAVASVTVLAHLHARRRLGHGLAGGRAGRGLGHGAAHGLGRALPASPWAGIDGDRTRSIWCRADARWQQGMTADGTPVPL